ncbi:MAG: methylenetetrahydrofolate reductase-domain-containing protein [Benjaminiella poitrasii]|nr:MAG: methylenetetrahydrofolate reductase-domain-containing protein [Benjaminiella poitrasii]
MKIVDKIKNAENEGKLSYSFEYFPPKTDLGFANLVDRMGRMVQLEPQFISCTWGAGGSTHDRTLELCSTAQNQYGLETLMHLTCTNMERAKLDAALKAAKEAGIRNILALRGDPPRGHEYWTPVDSEFSHAIDLVRYIRQHYDDYFCIGVAGYPEGHIDCPDRVQDMTYLKEKVDAGADFIMTQLFYDTDVFIAWLRQCRERRIQVPIVPGIMPIPTYKNFRRMIHLCNVKVPDNIMNDLDAIKSDDEKVKKYGVRLAVAMIQRLHNEADICNFHISTLNLERSTRLILEALHLHKQQEIPSKTVPPPWTTPIHDPTRAELWDEFPNGRYGDSRSPAYGENTFSASQILPTSQATSKWGQPESTEDLTRLFVKYMRGKIDSLPWCEERLDTESETIRQRLIELNAAGHWTVSSQPAVNGVSSSDRIFGWGPKGGYVYQKAFIEFFISDQDIDGLLSRISRDPSITYYAINQKDDFRTNVADPEAQNAVTWGVFPCKEIIQPTIIERLSFQAWKDEAFGLWTEWEEQYPPGSKSQELLKQVRETYWLVNVVHNDYQKPDLLFNVMLS